MLMLFPDSSHWKVFIKCLFYMWGSVLLYYRFKYGRECSSLLCHVLWFQSKLTTVLLNVVFLLQWRKDLTQLGHLTHMRSKCCLETLRHLNGFTVNLMFFHEVQGDMRADGRCGGLVLAGRLWRAAGVRGACLWCRLLGQRLRWC